ncbi:glycosyltransferase family 2 protein [Granulicella tundricola]|uniref:glycosyltransferase family 2 protein n=1 Tax=Granulicella tundricola TaxID=940615 RepID=UPI0005A05FD0|nr:glycosyltransferase family A protein [Granulicella tundricola]
MRFSVGIPTFNQAEYLVETIESLLQQTRPPDEIVISDHYSTDGTAEIIRRYAGKVRGVQPPPGVNLTGQYNFTLTSQTGDWITLLSSDDVARPNFCEVLERGAMRQPDAVLVRTGWENIDAAGKTVSTNYMLSVPKVEQPPATLISQKNGPKVSFAAFALKREAYMKSGPILGSLESLADWGLFLQMAPFGSFVYEHELISGYRVGHDGDKFRRRLGMWIRDEERIFREVIPAAAERCGMADTAWIMEAAGANFQRYLSAASKEFTPQERGEIVPLFQSWAGMVGGKAMLERFRAGETIETPATLLERAKSLLRPLAQGVLGRLRR